jgi:hypothetical protein
MNKKDSSLYSETDWERLDAMSDEDIDFSDIPELTEEDFKRAKRGVDFFKERGYDFPITGPVKITVRMEDGTSETYVVNPGRRSQIVALDPDVSEYFPDSESVNRTLRSLIALIPQTQTD